MKFYLKTTYPCLVKTETNSCELDENDLLEIEDERIIYIYPESAGIPFYINLTAPKENEHFSLINHDNKKIIFLEPIKSLKVEDKESLNILGKNCNIFVSEHSITFENNSKKLTYLCPHNCADYKIFKAKGFACVQFDKHLYAFNVATNKLSHISGDDISFEKDILKVVKNFNDSEKRVKTSEYKFDEEIVLEKEEFNRSESQAPNELLPFRMLESVKAKDYSSALGFLSENMKKQVDDRTLQKFFGNILSFLPLSTTEFITISGKQKNFVKFSLESDKIDDILIDEL